MIGYCSHPKRRILIEYVLLEDRNDSIEAAEEVATYLKGLRVTINLIPYNAQRKGPFTAPSAEKIDLFRKHLGQRGYHTHLRITKGRSIMAACGQLGNKKNLKNCLRKEEEIV
jgi:23S rRNA (adenine2503-C2)-methyltransferase